MSTREATPHQGLSPLDDRECYRLLAAAHLGRVALSVAALPVILPVHFALLGRDPVFRTERGAKLRAASAGNVLCLEVDEVDPEGHTGWSVLVTGPAEVLTAPEDLAVASTLPLSPWVGAGDAYVRIRATLVSGRRVG
ncbi:MAG TPA: pyridoxamine 5'-phosphate oxidase family protein [Aquihabitans sp.]|nr:pyridoxamine 5'-phosphate oxidase family protein [Aquihabitans sp.]